LHEALEKLGPREREALLARVVLEHTTTRVSPDRPPVLSSRYVNASAAGSGDCETRSEVSADEVSRRAPRPAGRRELRAFPQPTAGNDPASTSQAAGHQPPPGLDGRVRSARTERCLWSDR
jgi:hypothetical protein